MNAYRMRILENYTPFTEIEENQLKALD
jgi:hypothetical protein